MPRQHLVNKNFKNSDQVEDLTWLYIDDFDEVTDPDEALRLIKEFVADWHAINFGE